MEFRQRDPVAGEGARRHVAERVGHVVVLADVEFVLQSVDLVLETFLGRFALPFGPLLAALLEFVDAVLLAVERGLVGTHRRAHRELRDDHRDGQPVQELRDGAVPVSAVAQPDQACHDDHRRTATVTTGPSRARRWY